MDSAQIEKLWEEAGSKIATAIVTGHLPMADAKRHAVFAELVAAAERERCQAACYAISGDLTNDVHVRLGAAKCDAAIRNTASRGDAP